MKPWAAIFNADKGSNFDAEQHSNVYRGTRRKIIANIWKMEPTEGLCKRGKQTGGATVHIPRIPHSVATNQLTMLPSRCPSYLTQKSISSSKSSKGSPVDKGKFSGRSVKISATILSPSMDSIVKSIWASII